MRAEALREDYERIGLERGRAEGRAEGRTEGRAEGEEKLAALLKYLATEDRNSDIARVLDDKSYRKKMMMEFNL